MLLPILLIILGIPLFLLFWLIIAPIGIHVDTRNNIYRFYFWGLISVGFLYNNESIYIRLHIFFIPFKINLLKKSRLWNKFNRKKKKQKSSKKKKPEKNQQSDNDNRNDFFSVLNLATDIISSVRVFRFMIELDTGDYALNARLYPVSEFLTARKFPVYINYEERLSVHVHLQLHLIVIGYILAKYFIKRKLSHIKNSKQWKKMLNNY